MKKNILYVRTDILDQELIAGGSVTHTVGVIQGFKNAGYQIICASSLMISILQSLDLKHLYTLNNPRWLKPLRWKMNCLLSNIFFTASLLRITKLHTIHFIYQRYSILNCSGLIVSFFTKIPLILEYNGSEVWVNTYWARKRFFTLQWLVRYIENINIKKAHFIIVVSQALKDELIQRGVNQKNILVNPNGVDTHLYDPERLSAQREKVRTALNLNHKFVFGFIGTFSPWHGIECIATAIPQIIAHHNNIHFLLIGDGPLMPLLKEKLSSIPALENLVTLTGILPSSTARKYLAACDAFLSPTQPNPDGSRFFGSPTKIFEYMSLGKPIIASDLEQISDLIKPAIRIHDAHQEAHKSVGFLINPFEKDQFTVALHTLVSLDNSVLKKMGANARKRAIEHYSWNHHVLKIISFISPKNN